VYIFINVAMLATSDHLQDKEQADREAAEAEAEAEAEREKKKGKERKLFDDKKDIEIVDRRYLICLHIRRR
jgi:hypothetical protein